MAPLVFRIWASSFLHEARQTLMRVGLEVVVSWFDLFRFMLVSVLVVVCLVKYVNKKRDGPLRRNRLVLLHSQQIQRAAHGATQNLQVVFDASFSQQTLVIDEESSRLFGRVRGVD